jgi:8-oxo-dGTP diphosphatase
VSDVVRAAGGAVTRPGPDGELEVLLVHRPRYDDWTLPKGKLAEGESDEEGALREVEEETGLRCALGAELGAVSYTDRFGRPKAVRYWHMTPLTGSFEPNSEVDAVRWVPVRDAAASLSYEREASLLAPLERTGAGVPGEPS